MVMTALDGLRIRQALDLARGSFGLTEPNPRVGCVLSRNDGTVIGVGATQAAGEAHAEVMALRDARATGESVSGATAWVTLEPCSHHGRTPPCCDALIEAGISRCVIALPDPFLVAGGSGTGIARLRAAGIEVEVVECVGLIAQAREVNIGFLSRVERGRPWVRVKSAASADGRLGLMNGASKWITGVAARADGHAWRRRASAVLTGIGTVLADDPRLDVRALPTPRQPMRVVLDTRLRLPLDAALFAPQGEVIVVSAPGQAQRAQALRAQGAQVWDDWDEDAMPALGSVLQRLAARGVNELHVEAGPTLAGSLWQAGLVDEWLIYLAPMLLGPGLPMVQATAFEALSQAQRFCWHSTDAIGDDLRLRLVSHGYGFGRWTVSNLSADFTDTARLK